MTELTVQVTLYNWEDVYKVKWKAPGMWWAKKLMRYGYGCSVWECFTFREIALIEVEKTVRHWWKQRKPWTSEKLTLVIKVD